MSKKVLAISLGGIALASAAYLGTAWYTGKQFETHMNEQIKEVTASSPFIQFTGVRIQRGLFSSQHEMTISFNPECFGGQTAAMQEMGNAKLIVRQTVKHGPLLFGSGVSAGLASYQGTVSFDDKIMQQVKKVLGDQAPLSWSGTIGFTGTDKFEMKSPAFESKDKGVHVVWKGITGGGTGNFKDKKYALNLVAPMLSIISTEERPGSPLEVVVENVSLEASGYRGKTGADLGSGKFTIGAMKVVDAGKKEPFSMTQLAYKGELKENGEYLDIDAAYEIGSLVFGPEQKKYGPAVFALGLEHLHAPTAITIGKSFNKMMCVGPDRQAAMMQENAKLWKDSFATLLQHAPVLSLKQVKLGSPDGEMSAKGKLRIEGFKPAMLDDPVAMMSEMPKIVKLEFEAQAAEKLLIAFMKESSVARGKQQLIAAGSTTPSPEELKTINDTAEQEAKDKLQMVVSQNFAKHEGDQYKFSFTFVDGQAKLNGAPYALPFLPPPAEAPAAPAPAAPAAPAAPDAAPAAPAPAAPAVPAVPAPAAPAAPAPAAK